MHIFLVSIDGQWRWSPPGRLRVEGVDADLDRESLVLMLLRRARLLAGSSQHEFSLSLDGRSRLEPDEPLALTAGCCVHLLSPPRTISVDMPAPSALLHLRVEDRVGPEGLKQWLSLLQSVLRRRKSPEEAEAEARRSVLAGHDDLQKMASSVLRDAADPEAKRSPPVKIEVVSTESPGDAIKRACPRVEKSSPGRLTLCSTSVRGDGDGDGVPLNSMADVAPGDRLRLELPATFPLDVRLALDGDADGSAGEPKVVQVWVQHRYPPSGRPAPTGTLQELKGALEGEWGVLRHRQMLSFGELSLDDERRTLREYGVRSADMVDASEQLRQQAEAPGGRAGAWTPTTGVVGYQNGVPCCCTSRGSSTHFWWFLGDDVDPGSKVVMKYRDGPGKSWSCFSGTYERVEGWWRSPLWGARGNIKYEQSLWVDGECIADGLFGPEASEIAEQSPPPESAY